MTVILTVILEVADERYREDGQCNPQHSCQEYFQSSSYSYLIFLFEKEYSYIMKLPMKVFTNLALARLLPGSLGFELFEKYLTI